MENKQIGDFLKRLRMRSGYTQAEVGMFINVTYKAISRWESGTGYAGTRQSAYAVETV